MKYFSYDPNGEQFMLHETAAEAKEEAEKGLDFERDNAGEGWSDEVTEICWGVLRGAVVETLRRPIREDDPIDNSYCDELVEYELKAVVEPTPQLNEAEKALVDTLDGNQRWYEIKNSTGLPDDRCKEIEALFIKLSKIHLI